MKSHAIISTFLTALLALLAFNTHAQGTLILQHSGDTNPTNEGFSYYNEGNGQTGAVIDDMGYNAWSIGVSSTFIDYSTSIENISGLNWTLTDTLRIVTANTVNTVGFPFVTTLYTGSEVFALYFGSDANGSPEVSVVGASEGQPTDLNGVGSTYNTYQLVYNAVSDTASLWIDGDEEEANITGGISPGAAQVRWEVANQAPSFVQANWNDVSLEVSPEPSAISLSFLIGTVLIYVQARKVKG